MRSVGVAIQNTFKFKIPKISGFWTFSLKKFCIFGVLNSKELDHRDFELQKLIKTFCETPVGRGFAKIVLIKWDVLSRLP